MKKLLLCIFLLFSFAAFGQIIYEVYPDGSHTSSLKGAKHDIEFLISQGISEDYVILLDEGIYTLDEPLVFGDNISSINHSITLSAKEGTHPIIDGGEKILSWENDDTKNSRGKILKAFVNYDVRNLWVDNVRMKRSQGFVGYATKFFDEAIDGKIIKGLLFPKENFPDFEDISGLEIQYYQNWRNYYFKVSGILDYTTIHTIPQNQVLVVITDFDEAMEMTPKMIDIGTNNPFYFENSIDLLDEPGEWCYSPKDKCVYYYANENESLDNIDAYIPKMQSLILIKSLNKGNLIHNLTFSGLDFLHTGWQRPSEKGFFPKQSSTYCPTPDLREIIPAAIMIEDVADVKFEACRFLQLGTNGINIRNNVDGVNIENCYFSDISGSALSISDSYHRTYSDEILPVKNINIKNNFVEEIGEEFGSSSGFEAYFCENLTIAHNELYNLPYTGISVGWGWTMEPTTQKNVKVLNNKIIGDTQKCWDGGAIYSLSHFGGEGLVIEGNFIDEISFKPCRDFVGAVYTDEGSSNVRINNNVIMTDRNWFFYHQAGLVQVDSTYVLPSNHYVYAGVDALSGGTEIKFVDDGYHIFDIPNEKADSIVRNAGIKKYGSEELGNIDIVNIEDEFDCNISKTLKGIKIIPVKDDGESGFVVKIYGLDGILKKSAYQKTNMPLYLDCDFKGMHIIKISSDNHDKIYKMFL